MRKFIPSPLVRGERARVRGTIVGQIAALTLTLSRLWRERGKVGKD